MWDPHVPIEIRTSHAEVTRRRLMFRDSDESTVSHHLWDTFHKSVKDSLQKKAGPGGWVSWLRLRSFLRTWDDNFTVTIDYMVANELLEARAIQKAPGMEPQWEYRLPQD